MKIELYKQDGNKKRYWCASVTNNIITYVWGDVGGKLQTKIEKILEGKNIGKKNETTPSQQAESEMLSKVDNKKKKGYHLKGETSDTLPLPMLALQFADHKHKIDGTICVQPKYDGIRCVSDTRTGKMWSRRGTIITSCPHISNELKNLKYDKYLDGELYSDELTFQEITSIVRQEKQLHDDYKKIKYRVYDTIDTKENFKERYSKFTNVLLTYKLNYIKEVPTTCFEVTSDNVMKKLEDFYQKTLAEGYEGIIIRRDLPYRLEKRSDSLLKLKPMQDKEFKIVGFEKENHAERLGKFNLITEDGKEFGARPSVTHKELQKIYKDINSYIGKYATVKFQELTDDGVPRFPVVKGIRWEEDM